jgi:MSHA pilin protein MshC
MDRKDHGFTLIEIVVVLVLISIIAASVFTRSITTDQINFTSQAEKIKSHIRYAQSLAMKRNENWGIFNGGNEYWLFGPWVSGGDEGNPVPLPDRENNKVSLADLNLDLSPGFIIYFDGFGKPFQVVGGALVADLPITLENLPDRSRSQTLYITAETGLITTP